VLIVQKPGVDLHHAQHVTEHLMSQLQPPT